MGCFFACFRFKTHDHRNDGFVLPQLSSSNTREYAVSKKNNLSSMFLSEDASASVDCSSGLENRADGELKDEAKLLKACGALLETPAEIRKATKKLSAQNQGKEGLPPESRSLFPDTSFKKLHWDKQTDQAVISPLLANDQSDFLVCKSERCVNEGKQSRKERNITLSSLMNEAPGVDPRSNIKSVQFDGLQKDARYQTFLDASVYDSSTPHGGYKRQLLESKQSPYPTPLKLTDEMQTPGTVYPANQDNCGTLRNRHIHSQYVCPVLNFVVSQSQCNMMRDDLCQPDHSKYPFDQQTKGDSTGSTPQDVSSPNGNSLNCDIMSSENLISFSTPGNFLTKGSLDAPPSCNKDQEHQTPAVTMPSLSQWLKPPLPEDERRRIREASMKDSSPSGKNSDVDRPIIGVVAAHWNDVDPTRISPKWWDGNGIPNSTNKYKEDQKVNWHATPFEERLEKALSDDNQQLPGWKKIAKPIKFGEDGEECDTAASQGDILSYRRRSA